MKIGKSMTITMLTLLLVIAVATPGLLAQSTRTDAQINTYEKMLKRNPGDALGYLALADAFIRKARESGDPEYFNRAESALKQVIEIEPRNAAAVRHLAYVYYSRHEFAPAAAQAEHAIALNPDDAHAYGILGDALMETGEYDKARENYDKMIALDKSLYSYSRLAGIKHFHGDVAGSIADLQKAILVGQFSKQPTESVAWVEWQLGSDFFAQGKLAEAEKQFQNALQTQPNYFRALAGLAQVRAGQGRDGDAIELYRQAINVIPMPETIAALGELYEKLGRLVEARKQYELVEYIGKLSALNKVLYNRELAYFYADRDMNAAEGLELAKRELGYRKDVFAYDVYAWNLFRNGNYEAARAAIDEALKLGTQDAKLFFHAGMIYERLSDTLKAKEFLTRALATNPHFHVLFADLAKRVLGALDEPQAHAAANR